MNGNGSTERPIPSPIAEVIKRRRPLRDILIHAMERELVHLARARGRRVGTQRPARPVQLVRCSKRRLPITTEICHDPWTQTE